MQKNFPKNVIILSSSFGIRNFPVNNAASRSFPLWVMVSYFVGPCWGWTPGLPYWKQGSFSVTENHAAWRRPVHGAWSGCIVNPSAQECAAALNRTARVHRLRAKTFLIEDSRENEGSLDLLFFVLHLLIRNVFRCFKAERKNFQGEKKEKVKRKMGKLKEGIFC